MKKKIALIMAICIVSVMFIGCGSKTAKNDQADYVVVEMPSGTKVEDLFEFESISKTALGGQLSKLDVAEGCYCIGMLPDGNSVVWRSDDDGTGYDDCLFIYVEAQVSDMQVTSYAVKLKETPISYEDFQNKYNNF